MVCEPPGEPYYIGRIMEFLHKNNDPAKHVDALRVNWYYRPKDLSRKPQDTRQLFATMHSDIVPLNTLRGKCMVKHRSEIPAMDDYRKIPDCFWWEKFYDRYIQKNYDAIPTSQIINVPDRVKKVLDERWKFILVEQGRGKELTSASKSCKRCQGYCARYVPSSATTIPHPTAPIFLFSICRIPCPFPIAIAVPRRLSPIPSLRFLFYAASQSALRLARPRLGRCFGPDPDPDRG